MYDGIILEPNITVITAAATTLAVCPKNIFVSSRVKSWDGGSDVECHGALCLATCDHLA